MIPSPHQSAVQNFISLARSATHKQDFLNRAQQFDQRFLHSYSSPLSSVPHLPHANYSPHSSARNRKEMRSERMKNPFAVDKRQYFYSESENMGNNYKTPDNSNSQMYFEVKGQATQSKVIPFNSQPQSQSFYFPPHRQPCNNKNMTVLNDKSSFTSLNDSGHTARSQPSTPIHSSNEFMTTYDIGEPEFVRYYKKGRVDGRNDHQIGLGMAGRSNPFFRNY